MWRFAGGGARRDWGCVWGLGGCKAEDLERGAVVKAGTIIFLNNTWEFGI